MSRPTLHHHALIEGGPPLALAVPLFLVGWLVMVAAMMLPASLPTIGVVAASDVRLPRPARARAAFLAAFALVWTAFGLVAFLGDVVLHHVVDATPWLAARPWLIEAGDPGRRRRLPVRPAQATQPRGVPPPGGLGHRHGHHRREGAGRLGLRHGLACLGSSWALMLLMFAEGFASLGWMAP